MIPDPPRPVPQPKRIQRQRTKGWRMPAGAVYVGRPTKLGNPYPPELKTCVPGFEDSARRASVNQYRVWIQREPQATTVRQLRGKDLACWCPLDQPCHADVLLELANVD